MNAKSTRPIQLVALALVALMGLGVGAFSPALGSSGDDHKRTIRVVSTVTEEEFLDLGEKAPSLGDQFVFSSKLLKGGDQAGHAGVACTITSVEREELQCVGTFWFRQGQITAQALVRGEETSVGVITGGSGKYKGAEGELLVRSVSDTKDVLTFVLEE